MPEGIRVAVVDDHLIVRQGLKQYLAEFKDITWVGEAADGVAALALIASTRVDVLLLDLAMPGKSGLEVLPEIRARYPATHVVVVTGYPESHYGRRRNGSAPSHTCTRNVSRWRSWTQFAAQLVDQALQQTKPTSPHASTPKPGVGTGTALPSAHLSSAEATRIRRNCGGEARKPLNSPARHSA